MSNFGSRKPIHLQNPEMAKALPHANPSYESFRPNRIHPTNYRGMENRAGVDEFSVLRRYANGELDYEWAANKVIDAIHKLQFNKILIPLESAMLSIVLPGKFRTMEPKQAEILTKLSPTEKRMLRLMLEKHFLEEAGWNAGQGGGNVLVNRDGTP